MTCAFLPQRFSWWIYFRTEFSRQRYLGIHSSPLNYFHRHVNVTPGKVFKILNFIKRNTKTFTPAVCLSTLYFALVPSPFGIRGHCPALLDKKRLLRIKRGVQNKFLFHAEPLSSISAIRVTTTCSCGARWIYKHFPFAYMILKTNTLFISY